MHPLTGDEIDGLCDGILDGEKDAALEFRYGFEAIDERLVLVGPGERAPRATAALLLDVVNECRRGGTGSASSSPGPIAR